VRTWTGAAVSKIIYKFGKALGAYHFKNQRMIIETNAA
jgi:hypothetical protein